MDCDLLSESGIFAEMRVLDKIGLIFMGIASVCHRCDHAVAGSAGAFLYTARLPTGTLNPLGGLTGPPALISQENRHGPPRLAHSRPYRRLT
jgi:hypothetical protein